MSWGRARRQRRMEWLCLGEPLLRNTLAMALCWCEGDRVSGITAGMTEGGNARDDDNDEGIWRKKSKWKEYLKLRSRCWNEWVAWQGNRMTWMWINTCCICMYILLITLFSLPNKMDADMLENAQYLIWMQVCAFTPFVLITHLMSALSSMASLLKPSALSWSWIWVDQQLGLLLYAW